MPKSAKDAADRILDAAEHLFAETCYAGTSLRQITQAAGVNLAAVNYHFGTKEALYAEVVRRRIRPINVERLARLDQAVALAGAEPPPLDLVLAIMVEPIFAAHRDPARGGPAFVRIIARSLTEPLPFMSELLATESHAVVARFGQVVRRHAGHLAPAEFLWRMSFVIGALHHTLATLHQMGPLTRGLCPSNDYAAARAHFLANAVAVFGAPPAPPPANLPAPA